MTTMAKAKSKKSAPRVDFEDEDSVLQYIAKELGEDPDDLKIDDTGRGLSSFGAGTFWYIQTRGGGSGWVVAENYDAMREVAIEVVKQDLDSEPEIFDPSFIEGHIDTGRLRRELDSDVHSSNYDYFNEMDDDDLIAEAERQLGTKMHDYMADLEDEEDEDDMEIEDRDGLVEALAEEKTRDDLKDPMAYLEEIYSKEDAIKQAIEIAGIDIDAAAEDAVDTDGPEHFVGHYDGNSHETAAGLVYWRTD